MSLRLQQEAEDVFSRLVVDAPSSRDDVRRVMAGRRLELLRANRGKLKRLEARALQLIRIVKYEEPIRPTVVFVAPADRALWMFYRHILSSAPFTARPFRGLFLFCIDAVSGGVLGILDLGSDLYNLAPRDRFIGWNAARKFEALRHSVNVGTCVGVPPFGWLTGGKFMLEAMATSTIAGQWRARYGDLLALVVTTALYGRSSVYNRLPSFTYVGDTGGIGNFHLSSADWSTLKRFLDANGIATRKSGAVSGKYSALQKAANVLDISLDAIASHQPRGVYVAESGPDARPFMRGERADLDVTFPRSVSDVSSWWLARWCAMRHPKVIDQIRAWSVDELRVDGQIDACARAIRNEDDHARTETDADRRPDPPRESGETTAQS
jgi:hypothetical protein